MKKNLKYFGHIKRHNGLKDTILEGIVAGKEAEASHDKDGGRTPQMSSEWQQQLVEHLEKYINFIKRFGGNILNRTCKLKKRSGINSAT